MNYKVLNLKINFECKENLDELSQKISTQECSVEDIEKFSLCLAHYGKYGEALKLFLKLTDLNSEKKYFYYLQAGYCSFEMEDYNNCISFISEYLKVNDNDFQSHLILGTAYFYLGLFKRANKHWWAAHILHKNEFILGIMQRFFKDEYHPERMELYPICSGRGIDVGCGHRKTHPDCIGVDLNLKGEKGKFGNVKGKESVADVKASGDNLFMFEDNELDYVIQRHNLEHYKDIIKTLQEWKRVLKAGGILGMVVPDDEVCDTISLDPTHYHVFTQLSLKRILDLIGGFRILKLEPLLKDWSFVCIVQKIEGIRSNYPNIDISKIQLEYEKSLLKIQAEIYENKSLFHLSKQCYNFMNNIEFQTCSNKELTLV